MEFRATPLQRVISVMLRIGDDRRTLPTCGFRAHSTANVDPKPAAGSVSHSHATSRAGRSLAPGDRNQRSTARRTDASEREHALSYAHFGPSRSASSGTGSRSPPRPRSEHLRKKLPGLRARSGRTHLRWGALNCSRTIVLRGNTPREGARASRCATHDWHSGTIVRERSAARG